MPEPTTSMATGYAVAVGTVTLTGSFLGLQYDLLLAGFFGGCLGLSLTRQTSIMRLIVTLITSSLTAGYVCPMFVLWAAQSSMLGWTAETPDKMRLFSAFAIGASTQTLGPYALHWARGKFGGGNPQPGAPQ